MPFRRSATVSLVNASRTRVALGIATISHAPEPDLVAALVQGRAGVFHASSRRGFTVPGRDWTVLATGGRGKLVGSPTPCAVRSAGATWRATSACSWTGA